MLVIRFHLICFSPRQIESETKLEHASQIKSSANVSGARNTMLFPCASTRRTMHAMPTYSSRRKETQCNTRTLVTTSCITTFIMMNGVLLFLPRVANCYIQHTTPHISGCGGAGGWLTRRVKGRFCCEPMPRARGLVVRHVEGGGQGVALQGEGSLNPLLNVGKQAEVEQTSGAGWELGYSFSVAGLLFPYHLVDFIFVHRRCACNFILV